jgi:hypothetical protein
MNAGTGEASQARHEMVALARVARWRETWSRLRTLLKAKPKLAYIRLNSQTPCPPRGAVPVNQGCLWEALSLSAPGSLSVMAATVPAMWGMVSSEALGLVNGVLLKKAVSKGSP